MCLIIVWIWTSKSTTWPTTCYSDLLTVVMCVWFFLEQYCIWTDGLCALLGREMGSDLTRSDLDTLISMEMKLRLLDLENITIPEAPPPVPKEPSSYNFTYNYSWDVCLSACVFVMHVCVGEGSFDEFSRRCVHQKRLFWVFYLPFRALETSLLTCLWCCIVCQSGLMCL